MNVEIEEGLVGYDTCVACGWAGPDCVTFALTVGTVERVKLELPVCPECAFKVNTAMREEHA